MAHSVSGYVLYVSMWFNTKFVRVPYIFMQFTKGFRYFERSSEYLPAFECYEILHM